MVRFFSFAHYREVRNVVEQNGVFCWMDGCLLRWMSFGAVHFDVLGIFTDSDHLFSSSICTLGIRRTFRKLRRILADGIQITVS